MARSSATKTIGLEANVEGLKEVTRALKRLDKEADTAVRNEVEKISKMMAAEITRAGNSRSKRDAFVASTIRSTRERTPVIKIGSAKQMPVSRTGRGPRASDLMYGMEFGSIGRGGQATDLRTAKGGRDGWRFPERTPKLGVGNEGYWIYPTARRQQRRVVEMWAAALEKVAKEWGK
jgi:hypothetical protein